MRQILGVLFLLCGFAGTANAAVGQWYSEDAYLRCNDDVRRAVWRRETTAYKHYMEFGRYEDRIIDGRCFAEDAPRWFDEAGYLRCNPDVARALYNRQIKSGWAHYRTHGHREGRQPQCRR